MKVIDPKKPITPGEWEVLCLRWFVEAGRRAGLVPVRLSPPLGGKDGRTKLKSGLPDFMLVHGGRAFFVECKLQAAPSMRLGSLNEEDTCAGIDSLQAQKLDELGKAGCPAWIAVRLEVPALAPKKQASLLPFLRTGREAMVVQRLVPWAEWRALLLAGVRSVPYDELGGEPFSGAADLLRVLGVL